MTITTDRLALLVKKCSRNPGWIVDQNLIDLLRKKQTESGIRDAVDWDERRDKYLAAVNSLFERITSVFSGTTFQSIVMLRRRAKQLSENYLGTYSADDFILVVGDEQVRFSPRGRNIAGADGRVDVIGDQGETMLLLQSDGQWGFVESRQPTLKIVPFDESSLAEVLKIVMRI